MGDKIKCFRCGMTFHVGRPEAIYHTNTNRTRCAEPLCDKVFYHSTSRKATTVQVWVDAELPQQPGKEKAND